MSYAAILSFIVGKLKQLGLLRDRADEGRHVREAVRPRKAHGWHRS